MREHQIVISLKAEQFQEVQKLARAAGSQSVGAYVREHLLSFLGIEQNNGSESKASVEKIPGEISNPDFKFIAGELRRLHRELKILSSEASAPSTLLTEQGTITGAPNLAGSLPLATTNTTQPVKNFEKEEIPAPKENFLTQGAPIATDDLSDTGENSLIMPSSGAAIPGSMSSVGMPFGYQPSMLGRSPYGMSLGGHMMGAPFSQHGFIPPAQAPSHADSNTQTTSEAPPAPAAQSAGAQQTTQPPTTPEQSVNEPPLEIVSGNASPQILPLSQEIQIPQPPAPPPPVTNFVAQTPIISPTPAPSPRPNVSPPNTSGGSFSAQQDEMEVLAERAFAISPRLGAIEPQVAPQPSANRSFADTLEELLDAGLINQVLAPADEPEGVLGDIQAPGEFEDETEIFEESLEEEVADNNWTENSDIPDPSEIATSAAEQHVSPPTNQDPPLAVSAPQAVPPTPDRKDSIHEPSETGTPTPPPRRKKSYKND